MSFLIQSSITECQIVDDHDWEVMEDYHEYNYFESSTVYYKQCTCCGLIIDDEPYDYDYTEDSFLV